MNLHSYSVWAMHPWVHCLSESLSLDNVRYMIKILEIIVEILWKLAEASFYGMSIFEQVIRRANPFKCRNFAKYYKMLLDLADPTCNYSPHKCTYIYRKKVII